MSNWNEISGDHYTKLSWDGGLDCDDDGYPLSPPCWDSSISGGINARFAQSAPRRVKEYRCNFCRSLIGFSERKPFNLLDGSPHRCIADAARAALKETKK